MMSENVIYVSCVKKTFLHFTVSLTLAWISIRVIYIRDYFVAINTSQSDLNESLKRINKNKFMYVVYVI